MNRKTLIIGLIVALLSLGAWECGDSPVTPKSQCQDGSTKVESKHGHRKIYHCHNGEWIPE